MAGERDYVLGTHDDEIARLGLQHRVWRPVVLAFWERAGITVGSRILDVGAGPGYATLDLAEIVGVAGEVVAIERSSKFVRAMKETCRARSVANVRIHELDLMTDDLPPGEYDFSWCRWVLSFVSDPALLIRKIGRVLRRGSFALFHEYADYATWQFAPNRPHQEKFVERVMQSWRKSGGKADIALDMPPLLSESGFAVRSATPRIFCVRPGDYMWQWPAAFISSGPDRLKEMNVVDDQFAEELRAELGEAEKDPNSLMLTPLVLEILAEKH